MLERTLMDMTIADRKTESNSEKPNNCEDEPQTSGKSYKIETSSVCKDEPQTDEEYINNLPWVEVGNGEQTDEPQTDCSWK